MPKININGITREMTEEEILEMEQLNSFLPEPEVTTDDRLNEIETALIELASLLGGMIE
jgi:hypothetical protein